MRKAKKYHYIYKTTNLLNGRYYYGMHSTNNLDDNYLGSGTYLRRSIKKYGKENFNREIIEFCKTRRELKSRETEIVTLQEVANRNCYNAARGGMGEHSKGPKFGYTHSDEARKKMSIAKQNMTDDTKQKLREINLGKVLSDKHRKKMSIAHLGIKNHFNGKFHSTETKDLISKNSIGIKKPQKQVNCPHCNKVGGMSLMKRYHFDNCKMKKK